MLIKRFTVGWAYTNCYIVSCKETKVAIVIDPGFEGDEGNKILRVIQKNNLKVKYIINTHGHMDHTSGNGILKKATGAKILIHPNDAPLLPEPWAVFLEMIKHNIVITCPACGGQEVNLVINNDKKKAKLKCMQCGFSIDLIVSPPADGLLNDGDVVKFGNQEFLVIHTPGHSWGSISLYSKKEKVLLSGDTLFAGSIGSIGTPHSSIEDIMHSLKEKLMKLPEDTMVYPGHGGQTTIGREKRENPYLQTH